MAKHTNQLNPWKFKQPSFIIATEFNGTEKTGSPLGDAFYLEAVVRDTTSVTQDDPETTDIECETSDSPIDSVTKLGKYQFSAEVADTQAELIKSLMGFTNKGNLYLAPSGYKEKYVKTDVVFENGTDESGKTVYVSFCIPRLKLNSKVMLESMNSNIARVNLAGTAYDWNVIEEFSDAATYAKDDVVMHEGKAYKAKEAISTAAAWNDAKWDELTEEQAEAYTSPFYINEKFTLPA